MHVMNARLHGFRVLLFVVVVLSPLSALAFGSINGLGQSAEHEKITRLALARAGFQRESLDSLAGRTGRFGAVGAPDRPGRGLILVKAAHCDGGDHLAVDNYPQDARQAEQVLTECRDWIFGHLDAAVRDAGALLDDAGRIRRSQIPDVVACSYTGSRGRAKCNVLEALGLAFHASQDFYSHANWTDENPAGPISADNPPGLGNVEPVRWLDPYERTTFPDGLLSGCFDGFPEMLFCMNRVRHRDLNKDTGEIDVITGELGAGTTPRGKANGNFARAVRAAIEDTRDKWQYVREQIIATYGQERGKTIICAILMDDPIRSCR